MPSTRQLLYLNIAPSEGGLLEYPSFPQGPACCVVEVYVPRWIFCPSS